MTARDDDFARLLRALVSCSQQARVLDCDFLVNVLAMSQLEAALQWDGRHERLSEPRERLEALLMAKLRLAMAGAGGNIVAARTENDHD